MIRFIIIMLALFFAGCGEGPELKDSIRQGEPERSDFAGDYSVTCEFTDVSGSSKATGVISFSHNGEGRMKADAFPLDPSDLTYNNNYNDGFPGTIRFDTTGFYFSIPSQSREGGQTIYGGSGYFKPDDKGNVAVYFSYRHSNAGSCDCEGSKQN